MNDEAVYRTAPATPGLLNMYKNTENGLKCSHCPEPVMTQSHCISCPGMAELRDGLELSEINDMVTFFRRVLKERDKK